MLALNDLAFQNADILEALDESPLGLLTKRDLARQINRDESNLNKTLKRMSDEGLLDANPMAGLTPIGQAQLAAIRRAKDGLARVTVRGRRPLADFIPNPANRTVTDQSVQVMADTIEAVGDVIEPIKATPADANGVRMLLDGETRWRAVGLLTEQGRLPPALAEGIPFEERAATETEQILIRIVTASARTDLTPLDDARQLLALQQATGWTARDIAKKTGRSPADSDTGVRDVQSKIRVARDATAEALAQYELDGSWDRLRDSVTAKKPEATPPAHTPEPELGPEPAPQAEVQTDLDPEWLLDNPDWQSTEAEIREGSQHVRLRIFERLGSFPGWFVSLTTLVGDGGMAESYQAGQRHNPIYGTRLEALQAARRRVLDRHPLAPPWVRNGLDQQLGPHYVNGRDCLNASNAGEARRAAGLEARKANSGGSPGKSSLPPAAQAVMEGRYTAPQAAPTFTDTPTFTTTPSLNARADRMGEAARAGSDLVLAAAIAELTEAVDGHLAGIRRALIQGGLDLAQFGEDTEGLRDTVRRAGDAVEALGLGEGSGLDPVEPFSRRLSPDAPWVPVRKSITADHITCLHCGRRFAGGLRRHLLTHYNQTPDEYRLKWGLPADYPMVAPNHAKRQHDALRDAALRSAGQ